MSKIFSETLFFDSLRKGYQVLIIDVKKENISKKIRISKETPRNYNDKGNFLNKF